MEMFDKFDNLPNDYIPDNRPRFIKRIPFTIMSGGTATHSFIVPFNLPEECDNFEVNYELGLKPIISKDSSELTTSVDNKGIYTIHCKLSPEETSLFRETYLHTEVQVKFFMKNGDIRFSPIYKVYTEDSIDYLLLSE